MSNQKASLEGELERALERVLYSSMTPYSDLLILLSMQTQSTKKHSGRKATRVVLEIFEGQRKEGKRMRVRLG
jgi:hypothetical protein